jgi:hypothetical protein
MNDTSDNTLRSSKPKYVPKAEMWADVLQALEDLSFECDGGMGTDAPSQETYNRAFRALDKARSILGVNLARQYVEIARAEDAAHALETGSVDYVQFGWVPYHEKQGVDPDSFVEREESRTEIIEGWKWVPAYAAVRPPHLKANAVLTRVCPVCNTCHSGPLCSEERAEVKVTGGNENE